MFPDRGGVRRLEHLGPLVDVRPFLDAFDLGNSHRPVGHLGCPVPLHVLEIVGVNERPLEHRLGIGVVGIIGIVGIARGESNATQPLRRTPTTMTPRTAANRRVAIILHS